MKVYDVPLHDLERIADRLGLAVSMSDVSNSRGVRVCGRLVPNRDIPKPSRKYRKFSENGFSPRREIHAVCWHGFRDFFLAVFDEFPNARIDTAMADYRGREDFRRTYPLTASQNVGSIMYPQYADEQCNCGRESV